MPIYNITETKTSIERWEYTVFAENQDEALFKVTSGQVEAELYCIDEDPFSESEFKIEEEDYGVVK